MTSRRLILVCLLAAACNSTSAPQAPAAARTQRQAAPSVAPLHAPNAPKPDPREARLAMGVGALLEREHVQPHRIDDSVSQAAFAKYIEMLDPGKLFLLKGQVSALEADAKQMDDQLRAGDFRLARTGSGLMAEQRQKVATMVQELLSAPFDFTRVESLETDPEKRTFVASEAELKDRWQKALKREVLERIARMEDSGKAVKAITEAEKDEGGSKVAPEPPPPTFEGREKKAREDLAKTYAGRFVRLGKPEPLESAEMFVNAIASVYDPHTLYLAPAEQENFDIQISGSLEGIGAVLSEDDHYIAVREVVPGGAAWRHGTLEAGDLILAVKQADGEAVDVADMRINEVVKMIRGPKWTTVTLTVKKPDERVLVVDITRDVVVVEESYARGAVLDLGPKHEPVGYIYLPSFYGNTRSTKGQTPERDATSDVRALLSRFAAQKVGGVILDLRGNGGGLLNHATGITGLLIDRGPVVQARDSRGEMQVLGDNEPGVAFGGEVVVLVDRFSASASEILAGALQDYRRALIVGTGPTHGKGTVQAIIDLDRVGKSSPGSQPLGVVKLTVQQFFLVDGESTQWRGVQPDVVLPDPAAHIESGERYLDHAVPWSKVAELPATPWPKAAWDLAKLQKHSAERKANNSAFAKVQKRGEYLLERRNDTLVELDRTSWEKERHQDKKALDELDPKLDEGEKRFSAVVVDYRPKSPAEQEPKRAQPEQRKDRWEDTLAHDPWVQEALFLVSDMTVTKGAKRAVAHTK